MLGFDEDIAKFFCRFMSTELSEKSSVLDGSQFYVHAEITFSITAKKSVLFNRAYTFG